MICCHPGPWPACPLLAGPVLAGPVLAGLGLAGGRRWRVPASAGTALGHSGPGPGWLGPDMSGPAASTTAITAKAGAPRHARRPTAAGRGSQRRRRRLIANNDNGRARRG